MSDVNEELLITDIGDSNGLVYHYTKLDALTKIITEKGLVFHASRYDVMNDPKDVVYQTERENHSRWESGWIEIAGEFGDELFAFVASFSCSRDDILLWRLYDADICLVIDSDAILEYCKAKGCQHTFLGKVNYNDNPEANSKAKAKMLEADKSTCKEPLEFEAQVYLSLYKQPEFEVENEWRIECFDKDPICSEVKCKGTRYGLLQLYRELCFPKECLKEIILRVNDDEVLDALYYQIDFWLKENGYDLPIQHIIKSNTPKTR